MRRILKLAAERPIHGRRKVYLVNGPNPEWVNLLKTGAAARARPAFPGEFLEKFPEDLAGTGEFLGSNRRARRSREARAGGGLVNLPIPAKALFIERLFLLVNQDS